MAKAGELRGMKMGTEEGSREEERNEVEGRGMKVEEQTDGTELG